MVSYIGKDEIEIGKMINCPGFRKWLVLEDCTKCEFHQGIKKEPVKEFVNKQEKIIGYDFRVICNKPRLVKIESINKAPEVETDNKIESAKIGGTKIGESISEDGCNK